MPVAGSAFERFLRWVRDEELAGRPDLDRVVADLETAVYRLLDQAGDLKGARVLDLGSGTGAVAVAAVDRGARVTALDLDGNVLARGRDTARRLGAGPRPVRGDATAMPFGDASFDVSLHRAALVAVERPEAAVAEERRVLRAGGRVSCTMSLGAEVELSTGDRALERVWRGLLDAVGSRPGFTERGLRGLYEDSGFEDVRIDRWERVVALDGPEAVARVFVAEPALGIPARAAWGQAGIPATFVDEFLARLVRQAERGVPARLIAPEAFLTARR